MKKLLRLGILCGVLTLLLCVSALAGDSPPAGQLTLFTVAKGTYVSVKGTDNTSFSATVTGLAANEQCLLLVLTDQNTPTVDNIIYVNQAQADGTGKATFANVVPEDMTKQETYYIYATSATAAFTQNPATFLYYYAAVARGDANGNGRIQTGDATLILRYCAKIITESGLVIEAADTNSNGKIQTGDATLILRYCAKIIQEFPTP